MEDARGSPLGEISAAKRWFCSAVPTVTRTQSGKPYERIGLTMDESDQLEPEQSTTALVALHSQARYFSA